jgi:hypothetical protein
MEAGLDHGQPRMRSTSLSLGQAVVSQHLQAHEFKGHEPDLSGSSATLNLPSLLALYNCLDPIIESLAIYYPSAITTDNRTAGLPVRDMYSPLVFRFCDLKSNAGP